MMPIRLLLLAEEGLRDRYRTVARETSGFRIIGEALDDEAGLNVAAACLPDVILLGESPDPVMAVRRLTLTVPQARFVVLGAIAPETRRRLERAGVSEILAAQDDDALRHSLARLAKPQAAGPRPGPNGRVIACYNPKGGSGRSTLAVNLAIALYRATGRETFLVDAAFQDGELDLFLNLPEPSHHAPPLEAAISHPSGIKLLKWSYDEGQEAGFGRLIETLKGRGSWVVIDTHPSARPTAIGALSGADRVFVPFFLDIASLRRLVRDFSRLEAQGQEPGRFELVAWGERGDVSRQDAARILRRPIDFQLPYDPAGSRAAINRGIPLVQGDPHGPMARDLSLLVETLGEQKVTALVPVSVANPFSQLIAWLKKGPAAGFGA